VKGYYLVTHALGEIACHVDGYVFSWQANQKYKEPHRRQDGYGSGTVSKGCLKSQNYIGRLLNDMGGSLLLYDPYETERLMLSCLLCTIFQWMC